MTGRLAGGKPALSLVVCTRDRAERLPALLDSLRGIRTERPWEVVLVDSASSDATPEVLAALASGQTFGPLVEIATVREAEPGLARARNAGLAASRAPVVAFTDDDCYPEPDLADRWLEVFEDANIGWGSGRILLHDPLDAPVTIRLEQQELLFDPGDYVRPGVVNGANIAVRRTVLTDIGGFDERLGPGTRFNFEDVDMAARASAAGHRGGYFPGPTVRHHHGRRPGPELDALLASYDHGRGAYWGSLLLRPGYRRYAVRNLLVSFVRKPAPVVRRELEGMRDYLRIGQAATAPFAPRSRSAVR